MLDLPDMGLRRRPMQSRSWHLVEAVLEGSRRVFLERGFEEATLSEIALVAGVSAGSLYQYFASKQDLLVELTRRDLRARTQRIEDELVPALALPTWQDSMRHLTHRLLELIARDHPLKHMSMVHMPNSAGRGDRVVRDRYYRMAHTIFEHKLAPKDAAHARRLLLLTIHAPEGMLDELARNPENQLADPSFREFFAETVVANIACCL